jgi:uncharacterized Rmd1/YagE family protein
MKMEDSEAAMSYKELKAIVVSNEFNLDKIASHFGINLKFKWEDTLVLKADEIKGIIREPEGKQVRIFPFGSMVFANFSYPEITDIVHYLRRVDKCVYTTVPFEYTDDYRIEVNQETAPAINNDYMVVEVAKEFQFEIASVILAKSVALERIEASVNKLLDDVEEIVSYLDEGNLTVSDERLGRLSAKILGFKLDTISYIMLLDKPAITWSNNEAGELYDELSAMFELSDRFGNVRHKIDTLMDITEVFSGLAHAKRGAKLEWAIIILIVIEVLLQLSDKFMK